MAIRDTLQIGDHRLKAPNQPIINVSDKKIQQTITDLIDTMRENKLIGMAAQQIGENYLIFVTEPRKTPSRPADQADILRVYINPQITWFSKKPITIFEGCGSVAHGKLFAPVIRPKAIKIDYLDQHGQKHWLKCDGILARVIQHEYDHLQGIEFTEKIADPKLIMSLEWYQVYIQSHPEMVNLSKITLRRSQ